MSFYRRLDRTPFDPYDPRHARELFTTSNPDTGELYRCACGDLIELEARELPDLWAGRLFPNCLTCRAANRDQTPSPSPEPVNALEAPHHDHHRRAA